RETLISTLNAVTRSEDAAVALTNEMAMPSGDEVLQAVYLAISRINEQLPPDKKLAKAKTTKLASGGLDSLELVYFVVAVEDALSECGLAISLANAMTQDEPGTVFESVESLMAYLETFCEKTE